MTIITVIKTFSALKFIALKRISFQYSIQYRRVTSQQLFVGMESGSKQQPEDQSLWSQRLLTSAESGSNPLPEAWCKDILFGTSLCCNKGTWHHHFGTLNMYSSPAWCDVTMSEAQSGMSRTWPLPSYRGIFTTPSPWRYITENDVSSFDRVRYDGDLLLDDAPAFRVVADLVKGVDNSRKRSRQDIGVGAPGTRWPGREQEMPVEKWNNKNIQNVWKKVRRLHHQLTHLLIHIYCSRNVSLEITKLLNVISSLFLSDFNQIFTLTVLFEMFYVLLLLIIIN